MNASTTSTGPGQIVRRQVRGAACRPLWAMLAALLLAPAALAGPAIELGEVRLTPTWGCLGIEWPFAGDENRNAAAKVEFRRAGTEAWRPALPLFRHEFGGTTMLAGSIFRLCPDTAYQVRLTLGDPDGGAATQTVTARTLAYPRMPAKTVEVPEGGLIEAQKRAEPGTVMLLAKGTYPATALTRSGKPGAPIVYKAARQGEVVIEGRVEIRADHVWLHGLVLRDKATTIEGRGQFNCITHCRMTAHYTIHMPEGAQNWFIADNRLTGDAGGRFSFGGEGVDLGAQERRGGGLGGGHAVCYNEITDTADGISYGGGNIDVYGNDIHETVDDVIEPDYAHANYRVWDNCGYNSMCGLSFQPLNGGPWYLFGNVIVGSYLHPLKVKRIHGPAVLYGNSFLTKNPDILLVRGWFLNNVWAYAGDGSLRFARLAGPEWVSPRIDYNIYAAAASQPVADDKDTPLMPTVWGRHSATAACGELFAESIRAPASQPYYSGKLQGQLLPKDWRFEHYRLLPRAGSKLIDAGIALDNLAGPYLGKAPDIGAQEAELGTPWYGPRTWDDDANMAYGMPAGWKRLSPDNPALAFLGEVGALALFKDANNRVIGTISYEAAAGEQRWKNLAALVADDEAAETPVLEFQDGLLMRMYLRGRNRVLIAGRIEPEGLLKVTLQCRDPKSEAYRTQMFQFARSLYR